MKREYEIGLIINPETADEEAEKIKTSITDILKKGKGSIENIDDWGRKALAYPIEKHNEGIYVFIKTLSPGDVIAAVERRLKLNEKVMRFIVIRLDDKLKKTNKLEKKWKRIEKFSRKPGAESERERPSGRPATAKPAPKETAVPEKVKEEKVEAKAVKEPEVKEEKVEAKVVKEPEVKEEKVETKVVKEPEVKEEKAETKAVKEPEVKEEKKVKVEAEKEPEVKEEKKKEEKSEEKPVKPKKAPAKKTTEKTEEKADEEVENAETK